MLQVAFYNGTQHCTTNATVAIDGNALSLKHNISLLMTLKNKGEAVMNTYAHHLLVNQET
jgi:uncharacterized protein (DUF39 family)